MTEREYLERMKPGDVSIDNSRHLYTGMRGFQWHAVNMSGKRKQGVERRQEDAERLACNWAKST